MPEPVYTSSTPIVFPAERRRVIGAHTREWVLRHAQCPLMLRHGLWDVVRIWAGEFYTVARGAGDLTVFVVCDEGAGRVVAGTESHELRPGEALVIPAGLPHELHAAAGGWSLCLFSYLRDALNVREPALVRLHSRPMACMLEALVHEARLPEGPDAQIALLEILDTRLRQMAHPKTRGDQLGPVWNRVRAEPGAPWTRQRMAKIAGVSPEHLRRLCLRETGRTPMDQVARIRMQRAAVLLTTTEAVVEEIAEQVGYASARAFRTAFQRTFGSGPSAYRAKAREGFATVSDHLPVKPLDNPSKGGASSYSQDVANPAWHPVPLTSWTNVSFDKWFGHPLRHVKPGTRQIHGVPFSFLAEGCVMLRSERMASGDDSRPLPYSISVPVGMRVKKAYALHACGWGQVSGVFAAYRWHLADGTTIEVPVSVLGHAHAHEAEGRQANIQDWYFSFEHPAWEHARPYNLASRSDPTSTSQFLYTLEWINPRPDERVTSLEIAALPGCQSTLAVLAFTLLPA